MTEKQAEIINVFMEWLDKQLNDYKYDKEDLMLKKYWYDKDGKLNNGLPITPYKFTEAEKEILALVKEVFENIYETVI